MYNARLPLALDFDAQMYNAAERANSEVITQWKVEAAESGVPVLKVNGYSLMGEDISVYHCYDEEDDCWERVHEIDRIMQFIAAIRPAQVIRLMNENKRLREQINSFDKAFEELGK